MTGRCIGRKIAELEDEIEWIQATVTSILNEHTRVITICARSKWWWNEDIKVKRRSLGRAVRRGGGGQPGRG